MKDKLPIKKTQGMASSRKFDVMAGPQPGATMRTLTVKEMFTPQIGLKLGTSKT